MRRKLAQSWARKSIAFRLAPVESPRCIRMNSLTSKAVFVLAAIATALPLAANDARVDSLKKDFANVRALELPARAASAVTAAPKDERAEAAADAVRAGLAVNASSAPLLVGAIARAHPDGAVSAASAAAQLQPRQARQITRAAVAAAPQNTEAIVAGIGKAQPASFYAIGIAAVDVAPKSGEAILRGLSSATPALKTLIARAQADLSKAKVPATVPAVLKRVEVTLAALSKAANKPSESLIAGELTADVASRLPTLALNDPTIGAPYTPYTVTPGEITTSQTFEAPPGGRDYATP